MQKMVKKCIVVKAGYCDHYGSEIYQTITIAGY